MRRGTEEEDILCEVTMQGLALLCASLVSKLQLWIHYS